MLIAPKRDHSFPVDANLHQVFLHQVLGLEVTKTCSHEMMLEYEMLLFLWCLLRWLGCKGRHTRCTLVAFCL